MKKVKIKPYQILREGGVQLQNAEIAERWCEHPEKIALIAYHIKLHAYSATLC